MAHMPERMQSAFDAAGVRNAQHAPEGIGQRLVHSGGIRIVRPIGQRRDIAQHVADGVEGVVAALAQVAQRLVAAPPEAIRIQRDQRVDAVELGSQGQLGRHQTEDHVGTAVVEDVREAGAHLGMRVVLQVLPGAAASHGHQFRHEGMLALPFEFAGVEVEVPVRTCPVEQEGNPARVQRLDAPSLHDYLSLQVSTQ